MSRRKTQKRTKPKEIIRTDVWDLSVTPEQKVVMLKTVEEYRRYLKPLVC
jgi:putative transposase